VRRVKIVGGALTLFFVLAAAATAAGQQPASRVLGTPRLLGDALLPVAVLEGAVENRLPEPSFMQRQLSYRNVQSARIDVKHTLAAMFRARGLAFPPSDVFLRAFKQEQVVELWARSHPDAAYTHLRSYPMCVMPGRLGPKQREGDFQLPEGFYFIEVFNPQSRYNLSLGLDYPNPADRLRGGVEPLGGDIFIHGGCASEGCIPLDDRSMQEVYWLAVEARAAGQRRIPVHIFPTRLSEEGVRWLDRVYAPDPATRAFWTDLRSGFDFFETRRQVPYIAVLEGGRYEFLDAGEAARIRADMIRRLGDAAAAVEGAAPGQAAVGTDHDAGPVKARLLGEPAQARPATGSAPDSTAGGAGPLP
jgi:murein L,D-transpeptidase YafK